MTKLGRKPNPRGKGKSVTSTISYALSQARLKALDKLARANNTSRSALISDALDRAFPHAFADLRDLPKESTSDE